MFANKLILLTCLVWGLIVTSCVSEIGPTAQPEGTTIPAQQEPTSTVFIGIPPISNPLVQADGESVEEFVARIAARDISYGQPVLIALTQIESKEMLSLGVSLDMWDIQKCWFYETDSKRVCTDEDLNNYFHDQATPKIFFAFAYSDSVESLFLIRHFYYWDENYPNDYLRLFLELKDSKWIEKSILPYFW